MKQIIGLLALTTVTLAAGACAQDQLMKVKGGHQLGETAEQFFAEGQEKEALRVCAAGGFKSIDKLIRRQVKKDCDDLADAQRLAIAGKRQQHETTDESDMRKDTFTFDEGHLVKVELVYDIPSAEFNYRGHSFEQIFSGAKQAYGPPTNESTKQVQDAYGVPYAAHRELWETPNAVLLLTEQPGRGGSTTLVAFTRAEYDRTVAASTPKPVNPLE